MKPVGGKDEAPMGRGRGRERRRGRGRRLRRRLRQRQGRHDGTGCVETSSRIASDCVITLGRIEQEQ